MKLCKVCNKTLANAKFVERNNVYLTCNKCRFNDFVKRHKQMEKNRRR